jgi:hypothetical protein
MARGHTALSPLINSPQDITTDWADLGTIHDCFGFTVIGLYLRLDINSSQDFRVRVIGRKSETDSVDYLIPYRLETIENSWVKYGEYTEVDVDEDKNMLLFFHIEGVLPFFKIQIQGGFVGVTPAQITEAHYILGTR